MEKTIIEIGSKITVATIEELFVKISNVLLNSTHVELKTDSLLDFDLTFVQLIMSLKKTCTEKKINLSLQLNLTEDQLTYLQRLNIKID